MKEPIERKILEERILVPALWDRVMSAGEAAKLVTSGMTVGVSGFSRVGYPKAVPTAMAELGQAKDLRLLSGASTGPELDGALAAHGMLAYRAPFQWETEVRNGINAGKIKYYDSHLSHMPYHVRRGDFGKVDCAIIAATMVTEDCGIILQTSIGASDSLIQAAEKIILEIDLAIPTKLRGLHDVFVRPEGSIIPIERPDQRIGVEAVPCTPDKIAAIVFAESPTSTVTFREPDELSKRIAGHILDFLRKEVESGRMPETLFPLQSGGGNVANAVLMGLADSGFRGLCMYTEVVQDAAMAMIKSGVMESASATSISITTKWQQELYDNIDFYKKHLVLRSQDISNNAETAQRLGLIAMNTAMEADIYGNVNSTHIAGSKLMNGIGGSCDFARSSRITIFMAPSTTKGGAISTIVPMVSHVDSTEHDVDVIVTEHGLADLRAKCPRDRAELIIENCCDPAYRPALREYFEEAKKTAPGQHTPHDLRKAHSWHIRYLETGSMK